MAGTPCDDAQPLYARRARMMDDRGLGSADEIEAVGVTVVRNAIFFDAGKNTHRWSPELAGGTAAACDQKMRTRVQEIEMNRPRRS
jgi:hypothetical protein